MGFTFSFFSSSARRVDTQPSHIGEAVVCSLHLRHAHESVRSARAVSERAEGTSALRGLARWGERALRGARRVLEAAGTV